MRIMKWLAGLGALAILPLLILLVINLDDEAPNEQARAFQQLLQEPALPAASNAYLFLAGFAVAPQDAPLPAGTQCLQHNRGCPDAALPLQPATLELIERCRLADSDCLGTAQTQLPELLQQDGWLLTRYAQLLQHTGWQEPVPHGQLYEQSLPPFQHALRAQTLWLLQAWHLADSDAQAAMLQLQQDAVFWRRALRDTRQLISKMVATAALRKNLQWTNLALRRLPAAQVAASLPATWQQPLQPDELALRPVLAGEWRLFEQGMKQLELGYLPEPGIPVPGWLLQRLYQPQATANQYAIQLFALATRLDQRLPACSADTHAARSSLSNPQDDQLRLYNPMGQWLLQIATPDFTAYARQLGMLETARRSLLLLSNLRSAGLGAEQVGQQILDQPTGWPCADHQPVWDAATQTLLLQDTDAAAVTTRHYHFPW